jgi:aldose 1-epimerase
METSGISSALADYCCALVSPTNRTNAGYRENAATSVNFYNQAIKQAHGQDDRAMDASDKDNLRTAIIESPQGMRLAVLNYGATIQALDVTTGSGTASVVLSYPDPHAYLDDQYYMGATVGPFANRIRDARFQLDSEEFAVDANEAATGHCLHGGRHGLHTYLFNLQVDTAQRRIECRTELSDGAGGFPGRRYVSIAYHLVENNVLAIDFRVETELDTVISLANHAYFNLGGALAEHELLIRADAYTPVDASNAPTGEIRAVDDSEFDLRRLASLGNRQFDHNFVLAGVGDEVRHAATLRSLAGGLQLDLHTTQPGLQLYTGDYLDAPFRRRQGLCLEAQGFPDAPNQSGFPSARLAAGATYTQRTMYQFSDCY